MLPTRLASFWLLALCLPQSYGSPLAPRTASPQLATSTDLVAPQITPALTNCKGSACLSWASCAASQSYWCSTFFSDRYYASAEPGVIEQKRMASSSCLCGWMARCMTESVSEKSAWNVLSTWLGEVCPATAFPQMAVAEWKEPKSRDPPWPECAAKCTTRLVVDNVQGFSECHHYATARADLPKLADDCYCYQMTQCSAACTSKKNSELFATWYKGKCGSFTGLDWGWRYWPNMPPNPSDMYAPVTLTFKGPEPTGVLTDGIASDALETKPFSLQVASAKASSTGIPEPPVKRFQRIFQAGLPTCAGDLSKTCPDLYEKSQKCWDAESPAACFCPDFTTTSCPDICLEGREPLEYIKFGVDRCGNSTQKDVGGNASVKAFKDAWVDYANLSRLARSYLIPWKWYVVRRPTEVQEQPTVAPAGNIRRAASPIIIDLHSLENTACPTDFSKLGSFALINIFVFIFSVFVGRRTVIQKITYGRLGKPGTRWWPATATITLGLFLGANFINAEIIHGADGFSHVPTAELALLWFSRPRIAWVATLLVFVQKEQSMYFALGASALFSELVLQVLGSPYLGRTVNFARMNGFYVVGALKEEYFEGAKYAKMMYGGALLWIVAVGMALIQIIWSFLGLHVLVRLIIKHIKKLPSSFRRAANERIDDAEHRYFRRNINKVARFMAPHMHKVHQLLHRHGHGLMADSEKARSSRTGLLTGSPRNSPQPRSSPVLEGVRDAPPTVVEMWQDHLRSMYLSESALKRMNRVVYWMILPFIGQWLFWGGFVGLAQDLYCPPKLGYLTGVWVITSVMGVLFGSSF